jgi:hypothetical protein
MAGHRLAEDGGREDRASRSADGLRRREITPVLRLTSPRSADPSLSGRLVRRDNPATEIAGTLERLSGIATISEGRIDSDGSVDFDYSGETTVWWDEQRTAQFKGQRVFLDENGQEVLETDVAVLLDDGRLLAPFHPWDQS